MYSQTEILLATGTPPETLDEVLDAIADLPPFDTQDVFDLPKSQVDPDALEFLEQSGTAPLVQAGIIDYDEAVYYQAIAIDNGNGLPVPYSEYQEEAGITYKDEIRDAVSSFLGEQRKFSADMDKNINQPSNVEQVKENAHEAIKDLIDQVDPSQASLEYATPNDILEGSYDLSAYPGLKLAVELYQSSAEIYSANYEDPHIAQDASWEMEESLKAIANLIEQKEITVSSLKELEIPDSSQTPPNQMRSREERQADFESAKENIIGAAVSAFQAAEAHEQMYQSTLQDIQYEDTPPPPIPGLDQNKVDGEFVYPSETPEGTFEHLDTATETFINEFVETESSPPKELSSTADVIKTLEAQAQANGIQAQINETAIKAIEDLQSELSEVKQALQTLQAQIADPNVSQSVERAGKSFSDRVKETVASVKNWVQDKVQSASQWIQGQTEAGKQFVDGRVDSAKQAVNDGLDSAKQAVGAAAIDGLNSATNFVVDKLGPDSDAVSGNNATAVREEGKVSFYQAESIDSRPEQPHEPDIREQVELSLSESGHFTPEEASHLADQFVDPQTSDTLKLAIAIDAGVISQEQALNAVQQEEVEV